MIAPCRGKEGFVKKNAWFLCVILFVMCSCIGPVWGGEPGAGYAVIKDGDGSFTVSFFNERRMKVAEQKFMFSPVRSGADLFSDVDIDPITTMPVSGNVPGGDIRILDGTQVLGSFHYADNMPRTMVLLDGPVRVEVLFEHDRSVLVRKYYKEKLMQMIAPPQNIRVTFMETGNVYVVEPYVLTDGGPEERTTMIVLEHKVSVQCERRDGMRLYGLEASAGTLVEQERNGSAPGFRVPLNTDPARLGYTAMLVDMEKKKEYLVAVPSSGNVFMQWGSSSGITENPVDIAHVGMGVAYSPVFVRGIDVALDQNTSDEVLISVEAAHFGSMQKSVLLSVYPIMEYDLDTYYVDDGGPYVWSCGFIKDTSIPAPSENEKEPMGEVRCRTMLRRPNLSVPNERISFLAHENNTYYFDRWEGDVRSTENPLIIAPDKSFSIKAVFGLRITSHIDPPQAGSIMSAVVEGTRVSDNEPRWISLSAIPSPGYTFKHWTINERGFSTSPQLIVSSDSVLSVTAHFTWESVLPIHVSPDARVKMAEWQGTLFIVFETKEGLRAGRYDAGIYTDLGAVGVLDRSSGQFVLAVDQGRLYVVYADAGRGGRAVMKSWEQATGWREPAPEAISEVPVSCLSMGFSGTGRLYVACAQSVSGDGQIVVKTLSGARWQQLGEAPFVRPRSKIVHFSFSLDGDIPYIALRELRDCPVVKQFNGTSWEVVGNAPAFTKGRACALALKIIDHVPFLVYRYDAWKIVVARYVNGKWAYWEPAGIDTRMADIDDRYPLDFSFVNDQLYVVYRDAFEGRSLYSIGRYDGHQWNPGGMNIPVYAPVVCPVLFSQDVLYVITDAPGTDTRILQKVDLSR